MQPANTPYRREKITKLDSALSGGYVIKEASGVIVAAVPGSHGGTLSRAEGTADLLVAGANHLPGLLDAVAKAERVLASLRHLAEFSETYWSALSDAEDALAPAADGVLADPAEARRALDKLRRVGRSPVWDRLHEAASVVGPLLDAYDRARRDTPT